MAARVLALLLTGSSVLAAPEVRLPATADNSIVIVRNEETINQGTLPRIRIKGNQHLVAMKFDTSALAGRMVTRATLVARKAEESITGVTVSTIAADWDEGRSTFRTSGVLAHEGWAWPGATFPAVTGGNSFTLLCQAPSVVKDGAYHWEIDPGLVHALAVGAAHGLTIHEWDCDYSRNPRILSRESKGRGPYLLVELGGPAPTPLPPTDLALEGTVGDLRMKLKAPASGFAYEIAVDGKPLPRWNVPFVEPGEVQAIPVRDVLPQAGSRLSIAVRTLSRTGERSAPAILATTVPPTSPMALSPPPRRPTPHESPPGLAALPVLDRITAEGKPVGKLPVDYLQINPVFDGREIRLKAARGEVVGFQVLAKGRGKVRVACRVPGLRTDVFRALYVETPAGRVPDPLVPCEEIVLSEEEWTPFVVDVYVPFDFRGRAVEATFALSDGRSLPVVLEVGDFAIPRRASFACEMNGYGLPGRVEEFYRLQKVAYEHRTHVNLVHYSHRTAAPGARKCTLDMAFPDGRRMDERRYNAIKPGARRGYWDDFARAVGPYLTGAAFKNGHRGPVPPPGFYLTFHESWPLNVRAFWDGNLDAYAAFEAKPVYARTFVAILADFLARARREGWTEAGFQVYLNNKGRPEDETRNPWVLDEPVSYWDYRALAYYGDLVRRAKGGEAHVPLRYRIDISRPEFDRGQLAGKVDLWVVATGAWREYHRLVRDRQEREGIDVWVYGSTSKVEESARKTAAWALEAYRGGATGVLPWQTIDKDGSSLAEADTLGLFIFDRTGDGPAEVRHSIRLKAYREAEQLIEYLALSGMTELEVRQFIDACLGEGDPESPWAWHRLREGAAALIGLPPPRRR